VQIAGGSSTQRRPRASSLLRRTALLAALAPLTLLGGATLASNASASSTPKLCGYFFRQSQDFIVYHAGSVSCTTATKIVKDFVLNKGGVTQHGTSDADSYWTIKSYPGWRCSQSMGQGQCTKKKALASYVVKA